MKIGPVDLKDQILIVAEIGNNHEGSYSLAEEMVGAAAEAGATAVKFQTYKTEHYISKNEKERFAMLKSFELSIKQFEKLSNYASQAGLLFLSTPFDPQSAILLNDFIPAFKISSGDNTFYPLLETVARLQKPIILSGGLSDAVSIKYSKGFIERIWLESGIESDIAVLHCVTSYPAPSDELNLSSIPYLSKTLGCTIGYSDHALGIEAAAMSVALGARIVEKHFTINKNLSSFRDHQISADPSEMKQLINQIHRITKLMGVEKKGIAEVEKPFLDTARRSIVASRNLEAGSVLSKKDITWVRPAGGLSPGNETILFGRTLKNKIIKGEWITIDSLEEPIGYEVCGFNNRDVAP